MQAVLDVVTHFQMPGNEVEGFTRRSVQIALAGIYDLRIHHDEVIAPVLRAWRVFEREDFGPEGEKARDELAAYLTALDADAARFEERRAERAARAAR
jgi:acyl-[acyl-carrier-protein] desaturase